VATNSRLEELAAPLLLQAKEQYEAEKQKQQQEEQQQRTKVRLVGECS
jgi:hypothetical protein